MQVRLKKVHVSGNKTNVSHIMASQMKCWSWKSPPTKSITLYSGMKKNSDFCLPKHPFKKHFGERQLIAVKRESTLLAKTYHWDWISWVSSGL